MLKFSQFFQTYLYQHHKQDMSNHLVNPQTWYLQLLRHKYIRKRCIPNVKSLPPFLNDFDHFYGFKFEVC